MNSSKFRYALALVLVISFTTAPAVFAQTNKTSAEKKAPAAKKQTTEHKSNPIPFSGNIKSIDKAAGTITVGKRTFYITANTKIVQGEKPATLENAVVGDYVSGSYRKTEDDKLLANSIYFGGKPKPAKSVENKK